MFRSILEMTCRSKQMYGMYGRHFQTVHASALIFQRLECPCTECTVFLYTPYKKDIDFIKNAIRVRARKSKRYPYIPYIPYMTCLEAL